uniref:Uncharacterized protein n=1 Tax=viral metagenome TaxID=1070528 RepID=A0A6C0LRP8_9ZZZZ
MIYTVSNDENDIKNLLVKLRSDYGDYAFISYIDGEYGLRVWAYNSIVYTFYNLVKQQNIICIGITFKNTKCFLHNLCDHIIEIDDIELKSTISEKSRDDNENIIISNSHAVPETFLVDSVPDNNYYGNNAWDLVYVRGIHSKIYENILLEMKFSNIFYTLHIDGDKYRNIFGNYNYNNLCSNVCLYRINDENIYHTIPNMKNMCINNVQICKKNEKNMKTNKIAIWIRNSNKWSSKNTKKSYYDTLFNYCITENKICYVFQDIIRVDLPVHNNIIECNDRIKNRPNFDNFINICNTCDLYLGADSGPYYLLLHQEQPILKICDDNILYHDGNTIITHKNDQKLISILQNFYNS